MKSAADLRLARPDETATAAGTPFALVVTLTTAESVPVDEFATEQEAIERGRVLVEQIEAGNWVTLDARLVNPEAIFSVEVLREAEAA